jgi:hypothetical protein
MPPGANLTSFRLEQIPLAGDFVALFFGLHPGASLFPLPRFALAAMCAPSNIDSFAASLRTYRLAVS